MGEGEEYGLKKGSSYMYIIVWKMLAKIITLCEKNKVKNGPSIPTIFSMIVACVGFLTCTFMISHNMWYPHFLVLWQIGLQQRNLKGEPGFPLTTETIVTTGYNYGLGGLFVSHAWRVPNQLAQSGHIIVHKNERRNLKWNKGSIARLMTFFQQKQYRSKLINMWKAWCTSIQLCYNMWQS